MKFKIFTKADCPNCPSMKVLGTELMEKGQDITYYNLDEINGLTESIMYDVIGTPTLILVDDQNNEIKAWRSSVPTLEEVLEWV